MNSHEIKGHSAKIVSEMLEYCLQAGMIDVLLQKKYELSDADQIKQAIQDIANEHAKTAEYHKGMIDALKG